MNKYVLEDRSDHTKQHPAEKTADMRGHVDKPETVADADQPEQRHPTEDRHEPRRNRPGLLRFGKCHPEADPGQQAQRAEDCCRCTDRIVRLRIVDPGVQRITQCAA